MKEAVENLRSAVREFRDSPEVVNAFAYKLARAFMEVQSAAVAKPHTALAFASFVACLALAEKLPDDGDALPQYCFPGLPSFFSWAEKTVAALGSPMNDKVAVELIFECASICRSFENDVNFVGHAG